MATAPGTGDRHRRHLPPSDAVEIGLLHRAVGETLLDLRAGRGVSWAAMESFRTATMRGKGQMSYRLVTIYDAAAACGMLLDCREDCLAFFGQVAERLPSRAEL